jgi:uridine kinase
MSPKIDINIFNSIDKEESIAIEVARKLVQRDRVLQGYVDQYAYYSSLKKKPSEIQQYFDTLSKDDKLNECYVFLSNDKIND